MAIQLDQWRNRPRGEKVRALWPRSVVSVSAVTGKACPLERQEGSGPWPSCHLPPLPLLCCQGEGWGKGPLWPLTAVSEMPRSHRILGTCRWSSGALPLWLKGVGTPSFQEHEMQAHQGVVLSYYFKCMSSLSGCVLPLSPGRQLPPALVGALGEDPTEEEKCMHGFLCILLGQCDRKGWDSQCILIGKEKQCFQDPAT